MKGNWFAVNRAMFDHWVSSREDWFFAWQRILSLTDYETAAVNLTTASRDSSMSSSAWRHFINRLESDGMIDQVTTVRRGGTGGSTTTARITNWSKYQPQNVTSLNNSQRRSERQSERRYNDGPSDSPTRAPDESEAMQATVRERGSDGPSDSPSDVQYKNTNTSKNKDLPPSTHAREARLDGAAAFDQLARGGGNPHHREHQVRARIDFHAGGDFIDEHADDIPRWSREHTPDDVDLLWEASHPDNWRNTAKADKRRVWIFEDLLDQDLRPPSDPADDPLAQYTELGL